MTGTSQAGDRADGTAVYLYGVTRGLDPTALRDAHGVAGARVRGVVADGLTALVSTVRLADYGEAALRANLEDLGWLEATARAHHDVVDRAARAAPTAPVRIATIYRDDARVAEVLTAQGARFGEVLDRVEGRAEWGVKAYTVPEPPRAAADTVDRPAESVAESVPGPGGTGAGAAYLQRRRRERRRREDAGREAAARAGDVHAELADHAVAFRHHPPQDPRLSGRPGVQILNAAYLLDEEQTDGFLAVARAAGERLAGIEVEVTGPWPPYSFIDTADATPAREPEDR
ncbi:gas vesicle protein GvpL/GvpF [Actinomadura pelletieri DSM 43383]|uniref:Gas vesicle protein GvpL/GvpF n=1 Tax=Actinomadura pelletieri DSM 43383 TaxID=1120940 RepID=A0A495QLU2_9ACTN|nr:GvpL/GvpF family gas vesicle protein [Actinomadura pelletieri]RKS73542.1 gas vesicle protein GvpL/GvpF [Actinomadura pelletieri DSM 43383]